MEKTLKAEILKKLINELVNNENKSGYAIELWNEYCIDCSDVREIYYNDNDGISELCTYLEYIDIVDMASSGEYCRGDKFVTFIDNKFVSFNELSEYFDTDKLVNDYLNKGKTISIDFDEYIDFNRFIREYLNAIKNYDSNASTFAFEDYVTDNYNICELMENSFENIIKSASKDLTPPTSFYNKNDVWYAFEKLLKNEPNREVFCTTPAEMTLNYLGDEVKHLIFSVRLTHKRNGEEIIILASENEINGFGEEYRMYDDIMEFSYKEMKDIYSVIVGYSL